MTKTIYDKYDKQRITALPKEEFLGRIYTITTERDAEKAVNYLMTQSILGFDTETRPVFKRHVTHQVALLQVATHDTCFLFRLNLFGLSDAIVRLLEDKTITKVALSWKDDIHGLRQRGMFKPGTFIDVQDEVRRIGIEDSSLQKIYANLFGKMISKRQQLSNWEADFLSDAQKAYAALDAWACIRIHEELLQLQKSQDYHIIITKNENESETQADYPAASEQEHEENLS
ncbi:MAG: 3'-5' exonuclease domain-containing protein 2 [Bacteroidaceae bacterium]|nr:3'-5' exonuclease domain-containing protein 2 [Bacteroidaceae bacterium]